MALHLPPKRAERNRIIINFKGKERRLAITGRCDGDHRGERAT
jgi:hypothetical protein